MPSGKTTTTPITHARTPPHHPRRPVHTRRRYEAFIPLHICRTPLAHRDLALPSFCWLSETSSRSIYTSWQQISVQRDMEDKRQLQSPPHFSRSQTNCNLIGQGASPAIFHVRQSIKRGIQPSILGESNPDELESGVGQAFFPPLRFPA
jgi:hypothetical protein